MGFIFTIYFILYLLCWFLSLLYFLLFQFRLSNWHLSSFFVFNVPALNFILAIWILKFYCLAHSLISIYHNSIYLIFHLIVFIYILALEYIYIFLHLIYILWNGICLKSLFLTFHLIVLYTLAFVPNLYKLFFFLMFYIYWQFIWIFSNFFKFKFQLKINFIYLSAFFFYCFITC